MFYIVLLANLNHKGKIAEFLSGFFEEKIYKDSICFYQNSEMENLNSNQFIWVHFTITFPHFQRIFH